MRPPASTSEAFQLHLRRWFSRKTRIQARAGGGPRASDPADHAVFATSAQIDRDRRRPRDHGDRRELAGAGHHGAFSATAARSSRSPGGRRMGSNSDATSSSTSSSAPSPAERAAQNAFLRKLARDTLAIDETQIAKLRQDLFSNDGVPEDDVADRLSSTRSTLSSSSSSSSSRGRSWQWRSAREKHGEEWDGLTKSEKRAVEKGKILEHSFSRKVEGGRQQLWGKKETRDRMFPEYEDVVARERALDRKIKSDQETRARTPGGATALQQRSSSPYLQMPSRTTIEEDPRAGPVPGGLGAPEDQEQGDDSDGLEKYVISVPIGLEHMLEEELYESIFPNTPGSITHIGKGLVFVQGDMELLWNMAITLRLCDHIRVLFPPVFAIKEAELMRGVRELEPHWTRFVPPVFIGGDVAKANIKKESPTPSPSREAATAPAGGGGRRSSRSKTKNSPVASRSSSKASAVDPYLQTDGGRHDSHPSEPQQGRAVDARRTDEEAEPPPDPRVRVRSRCDKKSRLSDEKLVSALIARALPVRHVDVPLVQRRVAEAERAESTIDGESNERDGGTQETPEEKRRAAAKRDLLLYDRYRTLHQQAATSSSLYHTDVHTDMRHNKAHLSVHAARRAEVGVVRGEVRGGADDTTSSSERNQSTMSVTPAVAAACVLKYARAVSLYGNYSTSGEDHGETSTVLASAPGSASDELRRTSRRKKLRVLWDPFCTDGALLLEAVSIFQNFPHGNPNANYPFFHFPCHDAERFHEFQADLCDQISSSASVTQADFPPLALVGSSRGDVGEAIDRFRAYLKRIPRPEGAENPLLGTTYLGEDVRCSTGDTGPGGLTQESRTCLQLSDYATSTALREAVGPLHSVCFHGSTACTPSFAAGQIFQKYQKLATNSQDHAFIDGVEVTILTNPPHGPGTSEREATAAISAVKTIAKQCDFVADIFCLTGRRSDLTKGGRMDWRVQLRTRNAFGAEVELLRWHRQEK